MFKVLPQSRMVPLGATAKESGIYIYILTLAYVMLEISDTNGFLNLIEEFKPLEKLADCNSQSRYPS
jgi:hypothetical protein